MIALCSFTSRKLTLVSLLWLSLVTQAWAQQQVVWVDVRSSVERLVDHIEGDIHIPYRDIVSGVSTLIKDKKTSIKLYCRSGVRSGKAMQALQKAGYFNVENVGGIDDARKQRNLPKE